MASTSPSVKVIKTMPFKGGVRAWSNRYHFIGGTPVDTAHWQTLFDAVTAAEKLIHQSQTTIVECIGYAAGSDVPVASKTYALTGTVSIASGSSTVAGESVALVRYSTNARTVKNHPIYLFNYYHGIATHVTTGHFDTLDANTVTALGIYAGKWISGFSDGTITAIRSSPQSSVATGSIVEEYVTHRDFPYSPSR